VQIGKFRDGRGKNPHEGLWKLLPVERCRNREGKSRRNCLVGENFLTGKIRNHKVDKKYSTAETSRRKRLGKSRWGSILVPEYLCPWGRIAVAKYTVWKPSFVVLLYFDADYFPRKAARCSICVLASLLSFVTLDE